jgi:hypothetical protein
MNMDELLEAMERDDLADQINDAGVATIGDYARSRGFRPQLVHYHIRRGHIEKKRCACGRWTITVAQADAVMVRGRQEVVPEEEEIPGSDLDSRESER